MEREHNFWVFGLACLPLGSSGSMRSPFCVHTRDGLLVLASLNNCHALCRSIARNRSLSPLCLVLDCTYGWQCSHEWQCPNSTFLLFHLYKHGSDFRHQGRPGQGRPGYEPTVFCVEETPSLSSISSLSTFFLSTFSFLWKILFGQKKVFPSVASDGDSTSRTRPSVETFLMMCP